MNEKLKQLDLHYNDAEAVCIENLVKQYKPNRQINTKVNTLARQLVEHVRNVHQKSSSINAFMTQYDLSSEEGITLMCLAEALLRIPDKDTVDRFIEDKLTMADWKRHMGKSDSWLVNASTWGLLLTGKILKRSQTTDTRMKNSLHRLLKKHSVPVIRKFVMQAMKVLGKQFVMATTITSALEKANAKDNVYQYSYDMLGEAAMNETDAKRYCDAYENAIVTIGNAVKSEDPRLNPGISVKLSALHSRYRLAQYDRVMDTLYPRLKALALLAKKNHCGFTIDAEESYRLTLSLEIFEKLAHDPELAGWQGLGLAVQAYQKRAPFVLEWLSELSQQTQHRFMVRLVKGAYWDSEIKYAQEQGFDGYPVYTRKSHTDIAYLSMAQYMLSQRERFYCQFATHNAHTIASVITYSDGYSDYEFQRLHGMGEDLYAYLLQDKNNTVPCRVYAPVGSFEHLLAYLVRRLLENGANTSFVNNILDLEVNVDKLIHNPFTTIEQSQGQRNSQIPLPIDIYGKDRKNAKGYNLDNVLTLEQLEGEFEQAYQQLPLEATPLLAQQEFSPADKVTVHNPANTSEIVGHYFIVDADNVNKAIDVAKTTFEQWRHEPVENNAQRLEKMADLLEQHMPRLMALTIKEAGKSYPNAIAELREAIDFCRYYAVEARKLRCEPTPLPGPTGEDNYMEHHPRGVIACISPWNFPLAILLGEITAALAVGNVVLSKPAGQTTLIAYEAVKLLHEAGFPKEVVQLLPGSGSVVGAALSQHKHVNGIIFTGSNPTARHINLSLANKPGAITPLIAETGGQNCMLVDSSALHEQVVEDVIRSAFDSAGQRCSALRVLFLQEDIADAVVTMIKGAMDDLVIGAPQYVSTDVGPVIDTNAQKMLNDHIEKMRPQAKDFYQLPSNMQTAKGHFVLPTLIEIESIEQLSEEVFGPVLHVIRFKGSELENTLHSVNSTGYGLTFGVHSRLEQTIELAKAIVTAGNLYINRNQVGAIVGSQPFGGEGLSGTGPKAGGPYYLPRLCVERSYSTDTTAAGGNASLLEIGEM